METTIAKILKVSFEEQSKAVVANVSLEGPTHTPEEQQKLLQEAEQLFAQAYRTAQRYTFDKAR